MLSSLENDKARHLSWRAGFNAYPTVLNNWEQKNWNQFFLQMVKGGTKEREIIMVSQAKELFQKSLDIQQGQRSKEDKRALRKINSDGMKALNLAWLNVMTNTDHPLREKMALFWHGHFACRVNQVIFSQQMLEVIRKNALNNFGTLLKEVSKSPAMLQFLNNQQNKKQHPNENFAREVMELFTMGHGNYTEKDVKEGARAFTGWGYNKNGEFVFRKRLHDDGVKTFLGKTGSFTGEDILDILLQQRATAHHITEKIYKYFVNFIPDKGIVDQLAEQFYQSNYDISALMETIFRSEWFYAPQNQGNLIKSPVELLVGMQRTIPATFGNEKVELLFQRIMDQTLFYPPNVAGWPGGRSWIDSSTLLFRMRLPQIMYYSENLDARPKDMPDEMTEAYSEKNKNDQFVRRYARRIKSSVQWNSYLDSFKGIAKEHLSEKIMEVLLTGNGIKEVLQKRYSGHIANEDLIRAISIDVMSTPEYQVC